MRDDCACFRLLKIDLWLCDAKADANEETLTPTEDQGFLIVCNHNCTNAHSVRSHIRNIVKSNEIKSLEWERYHIMTQLFRDFTDEIVLSIPGFSS